MRLPPMLLPCPPPTTVVVSSAVHPSLPPCPTTSIFQHYCAYALIHYGGDGGGLGVEEVGGAEKLKRSEESDGLSVSIMHHTKLVYWYSILLAMNFYFIYIERFR